MVPTCQIYSWGAEHWIVWHCYGWVNGDVFGWGKELGKDVMHVRFWCMITFHSSSPLVHAAGADICGFQLNTTPELCARWVSMGAFYPFARSHSDRHSSRQELFLWPEVADAGRAALKQRYRLLPYIYTTMRKAHDTGAPAMRPLWMNFPEVAQTHLNDRQFMFGDSLLVTPVLNEGARSVQGFFPPGRWYSLWNTSDLVEPG